MMRAGRLGRTIRTDTHRYVEWTDRSGAVVGRELYDHRNDPEENENLADTPAQEVAVREHAARLAAGWREAQAGNR
jgi:hypothetical protein